MGDTDLLVDDQVDRFRFMEENEEVMNRAGEPGDGTPPSSGRIVNGVETLPILT